MESPWDVLGMDDRMYETIVRFLDGLFRGMSDSGSDYRVSGHLDG